MEKKKKHMSLSFIVLVYLLVGSNALITPGADPVTVETVTIETTTEKELIITDIPEEAVDKALYHLPGTYSTMSFHYYNKQNEYSEFSHLKHKQFTCVNDYLRCALTQSKLNPVCSYHDFENQYKGFRVFNSYCELYFDNCRRGYRFWRSLGFGKCYLPGKIRYVNVVPT